MGLLAAGLGVFAVGDIIYLVRLSTDSYAQGTFLDAFWLVGLAVVSMSAWRRTRRPASARAHDPGSLAVTIVFSAAAIVVLVAASTTKMPPTWSPWLRRRCSPDCCARCVAFRQARQLAEVRHQATTDDLTGLPNRRAFTALLDADARRRPLPTRASRSC